MGNTVAVRVTVGDVLRHPRLRFRLLIMSFAWSALSASVPLNPLLCRLVSASVGLLQ